MEISILLEILKLGTGPAVAAVVAYWLKKTMDRRDYWRDKYLSLRDQRDKESRERKIEQENTIEVLQKLLEEANKD
jgi:hypothetical protein